MDLFDLMLKQMDLFFALFEAFIEFAIPYFPESSNDAQETKTYDKFWNLW